MALIKNAALTAIAPTIARRARWSWVGYGAAAYVLLRVARRYGFLGSFPDRALTLIESNVRSAVGLADRRSDSVAASAQI